MKMSLIAVAATVVLAGVAPVTPAAAQHRGIHRGHHHPVCHWESRHHHRVRVCR